MARFGVPDTPNTEIYQNRFRRRWAFPRREVAWSRNRVPRTHATFLPDFQVWNTFITWTGSMLRDENRDCALSFKELSIQGFFLFVFVTQFFWCHWFTFKVNFGNAKREGDWPDCITTVHYKRSSIEPDHASGSTKPLVYPTPCLFHPLTIAGQDVPPPGKCHPPWRVTLPPPQKSPQVHGHGGSEVLGLCGQFFSGSHSINVLPSMGALSQIRIIPQTTWRHTHTDTHTYIYTLTPIRVCFFFTKH